MKSQTAIEYMFVVIFGLAVVIPVFYYSLIYSSESVVTSQAQEAVNTLAKTADYVYALGEGSSSQVLITIPQKVVNSSVQGKFIVLQLKLASTTSDIKANTKANVSGTIPIEAGSYKLFLNMTKNDVKIQKVGS